MTLAAQDDLEEVRIRERVIVRHRRQVAEVDEAERRQGCRVDLPPCFLKNLPLRGLSPRLSRLAATAWQDVDAGVTVLAHKHLVVHADDAAHGGNKIEWRLVTVA